MSCLEHEKVEKYEDSGTETEQKPRPFLVPNGTKPVDNQVTRRVTDILDYELERGLMPS